MLTLREAICYILFQRIFLWNNFALRSRTYNLESFRWLLGLNRQNGKGVALEDGEKCAVYTLITALALADLRLDSGEQKYGSSPRTLGVSTATYSLLFTVPAGFP